MKLDNFQQEFNKKRNVSVDSPDEKLLVFKE